jgi:hypothetical protein
MKDALRARATVGEVCNALRDVWGGYIPADTFWPFSLIIAPGSETTGYRPSVNVLVAEVAGWPGRWIAGPAGHFAITQGEGEKVRFSAYPSMFLWQKLIAPVEQSVTAK